MLNQMSVRKPLNISWTPERRDAWSELARSFGWKPTPFAQRVLEEFLACFAEDRKLKLLGLSELAVDRPGSWLKLALMRTAQHTKAAQVATEPESKKKSGRVIQLNNNEFNPWEKT